MEVFKEVKGFNNYAVSTLGRVRRLTKGPGAQAGRILRPTKDRDGYLYVTFYGVGVKTARKVHRLVCDAFLGPRDGLETNHKNGDKTDNRLCNLELVTASENRLHAYRTGLLSASGEQHHQAKLSDKLVREIRVLRAEGFTYRAIGDRMGVTQANISHVLRGKTWRHVV